MARRRASTADNVVIAGLDIGGTKIGVSLGTNRGDVLASERLGVDHALAPAAMLDRCAERLEVLIKRAKVEPQALGAACPGPFDYARKRFLNPPNNPRWHGFALGAYLNKRFAMPTSIMNDANAAAYSEWLWGAARGSSSAVFLTMSTGMGCGLVLGGRLYEGPSGLAGEIGQIRLTPGDDGPVGFGKRGSVEGYLSGPGMQQMARAEALMSRQLQQPSGLLKVLDSTGDISTRDLCELAMKRDQSARRVTDRVARELGRLCAILTDVLNPEVIVIGTIASAYPKLFLPGARAVVRQEAIPASARVVRLRPSGFAPEERGDKQALAVASGFLNAR
jgi:glucokinase